MTLRTPMVKVGTNNVSLPSGDHVAGDIGLVTLNYGTSNIEAGLINAWGLGESSGTRYASVGSLDLTNNNSVGVTAGKVGYGARFDETRQDSLTHSDHPDLSVGARNWQTTLWVKVYDHTKTTYLMRKATDNQYGDYYFIYAQPDDKFRFTLVDCQGTNASPQSDTYGAVSNGVWVMAALRYDYGKREVGININDTGWDTETLDYLPRDGNETFTLGGWSPLWSDSAIESVHMWHRLLSADELTYMYNNGNGRELSGSGTIPVKAMPVYTSGNKVLQLARANTSTSSQVTGLLLEPTSALVQTNGCISATTAQWNAIGASVGGLTENTKYFLDPSNAGRITSTAPATTGQYLVELGTAMSATALKLNIKQPILL